MHYNLKKIYRLSRWLYSDGNTVESRLVTDMLRKQAQKMEITLEQLKREFPEAASEALAGHMGPIERSDLEKIFPYADIDRNIEEISSMQELRESITYGGPAATKTLESRILNENFSLKHTDFHNLDKDLVSNVQSLLNAKGLKISSSGDFSVDTKDKLIIFQAANGLGQSGEINKETLNSLRSPSSKGSSLVDTESFETGTDEEAELEGGSSATSMIKDPGLGEVLRKRNTPEKIPSRTTEAGEIFSPKFSFTEEPCLNCAAMAIQESKDKWDNGNISEEDEVAEHTIMEYFRYSSQNNSWERNIDRWGFEGTRRYGPKAGKNQMNPVKERDEKGVAKDWYHWSAVFTSFIMGQHDGEGAKWFVSEAHTPYIEAFQKRRREIERDPEGHKDKMYYVWFSKQEMDSLGMKPEPGDLVGTKKHCDIYIGGGQMIGGNTCAKSEYTGGKTKNCKGTSGPKPIRWGSGSGIIKRVKVTGSGKNRGIA